MGAAAHQLGLGLGAIGAAAVGGFGVAVGAAAEFEQKMDHFGAVTGATAEQVAAVSEQAREMGRTSVFSAIEAAGAMVELGKAGLSVQDIMGGIGEAVLALAAAGDLPLIDSTEILANVMRTFNLEAKDAVFIADQLAGAANASTIEVKDLAVSLRYTGSVASALGVPLNEVAEALAILGNNGIRGSTAGTTLRRILLELNPATKRQTEALTELGIIQENANFSAEDLAVSLKKVTDANNASSTAQERVNTLNAEYAKSGAPATAAEAAKRTAELATANEELADAQDLANRAAIAHESTQKGMTNEFFKADGTAKSLGEVFQILENRTKHLNAAEKQRVLDTIFGSRAIAGALILAKEGAAGFEEISKQIEKVSAAEVARERLDNLSGSLRRLKNILITEMVEAATPLLATLDSIVKFVTRVVTSFGNLPEGVRTASLVFLLLFGTAAILGAGLLLLVSFIAKGVRAFVELRNVMSGTNVAKKALDKNVPILSGLMGKLGVVVRALLSPFKLLIVLFKAAVVAIAAFFGISVGLLVLIVAIAAAFVILLIKCKPVREFFINLGQTILDFVQKVPGYLGGFVSTVAAFFNRLGDLITGAADAVGRFFQRLPGIIGSAIGGVLSFIASTFMSVVEAVGGFFSRLPGVIGGALSTAIGAVGNFIASIGRFFMSLPGIVLPFLGQILAAVVDFFVQLPLRLAYFTGYFLGLWVRLWLGLISIVTQVVTTIITTVAGFFIMLFNTAVEWGPKIFNAVVEFFMLLPGRIVGFLDMVWDSFYAWSVRMFNTAVEVGTNVFNAIVEWFQQLPGVVIGFIDSTWDSFYAWSVRMFNTAVEMGTNVINSVIEWFQQLPGVVIGFIDSTWDSFYAWSVRMWNTAIEAGTNVLNAIIEWFQQLPGAVAGFIDDVFDRFTTWANNMWTRAVDMARDIYNGIVNGLQNLPNAVSGILGQVIDAFLGIIRRGYEAAKNLAGALWNGFKAGLGISSPSYIERAMFAMTDNVTGSIKDLRGQVKTIQSLAQDLATPTSVNFNSPAAWKALENQINATVGSAGSIGQQAQNVFNNEFHTNADPEEISSQIMWDQLVRVR